MSHIRNSVRRHSTSSGYLTSGILSGQRSISSGCLTSGILFTNVPSPPDISHPEFCPADNSYSPDSLAHQTLTIRRIHFCPQSSAPLDFNKHEQNSWFQIMEFIESTHAKLTRALERGPTFMIFPQTFLVWYSIDYASFCGIYEIILDMLFG